MNHFPELEETLLSSDEKFNGRVIRVTVDTIRLPNGKHATREIVHHRGAIGAVPVDDKGCVHLVRQWRHAARQALLEIPAGVLNTGEDLETCLQRELAEEIGQVPHRWQLLNSMYAAPGYGAEVIHLYLARDLQPYRLPADDDENLQSVVLPLSEAIDACLDGRICDGKSLAGLLLARQVLEREGGL